MSSIDPLPRSAGILMYRCREGGSLELLLGHKGGPFWSGKDVGAWSIPKGRAHPGESDLDAALREFVEETSLKAPRGNLIDLGEAVGEQKIVRVYASKGVEIDAAELRSNMCRTEWPPASGVFEWVPEIDRWAWAAPDVATRLLSSPQEIFPSRLLEALWLRTCGPEPATS